MITSETFREIRECACEAWLEVGLDKDEHELVEIIGICSQKIYDLTGRLVEVEPPNSGFIERH